MSDNTTENAPFTALTDAWLRWTETAVRSATAVNRAALASLENGSALGGNGCGAAGSDSDAIDADGKGADTAGADTAGADAAGTDGEVRPGSIDSLAYEDADWTFERSVEDADEIAVGDTVTFTKRITEEDIGRFAAISGDTNRLHLDDDFAGESRFGGRIAHGTLVSGLISAALARLPGLSIYLSQDLEFRRPVEVGDRVHARVEVVEDLGNGQYRLTTIIHDDEDTTIIDGEAVVLIDELPEE